MQTQTNEGHFPQLRPQPPPPYLGPPRPPSLAHTFSAFWLRSSVVSVLISLISDMYLSVQEIKLISRWGPWFPRASGSRAASRPAIALPAGVAHPFGTLPFLFQQQSKKTRNPTTQHPPTLALSPRPPRPVPLARVYSQRIKSFECITIT